MKKVMLLIAAVVVLSSVGCIKPFHEAMRVDTKTSEVVFLCETVNENGQAVSAPDGKGGTENGKKVTLEDYYSERYINARKVEIPYYWKRTKHVWFWESASNGMWKPGARLIAVDTAPTTRTWTPRRDVGTSASDQGLWVESKDSVGFATGISLTARIENKDDAVKFLSNYPPEDSRKVETYSGEAFNVEITSLKQVMDEEIFTKVLEVYAYECAAEDMDTLRDKKQEIINKVKETVIPFFETRGITITSIGQFGGFTYENPKNQEAIDAVFAAQQDKEVAIAEASAAEERKVALKLAGEGEAQKAVEAAKGKAEAVKLEAEAEAAAIQAVADAKAYELEKLQENPEAYLALKKLEVEMERLNRWDGKYPTTLFGDGLLGEKSQMLLNVPTNLPKKVAK